MTHYCTLITEGYQIIFELESREGDEVSVDIVVEFRLVPPYISKLELSVQSVPSCIDIKDLRKLVSYFEQHMTLLKKDNNTESPTFIEYGLSFQMDACSGDIDDEDGKFALRTMVNVGSPMGRGPRPRTYVGGIASVTFTNVNSFISSLNTAIAKLSP